jgi:hypothetical protein
MNLLYLIAPAAPMVTLDARHATRPAGMTDGPLSHSRTLLAGIQKAYQRESSTVNLDAR